MTYWTWKHTQGAWKIPFKGRYRDVSLAQCKLFFPRRHRSLEDFFEIISKLLTLLLLSICTVELLEKWFRLASGLEASFESQNAGPTTFFALQVWTIFDLGLVSDGQEFACVVIIFYVYIGSSLLFSPSGSHTDYAQTQASGAEGRNMSQLPVLFTV